MGSYVPFRDTETGGGRGGRAEAWKERQIGSYIERTDKGAGIVRLRALLNPISGGKGTRLD